MTFVFSPPVFKYIGETILLGNVIRHSRMLMMLSCAVTSNSVGALVSMLSNQIRVYFLVSGHLGNSLESRVPC